MTDDPRRRQRLAQAERLRELAAASTDPAERDRLLDAAVEAEGVSLNGAGFARATGDDAVASVRRRA